MTSGKAFVIMMLFFWGIFLLFFTMLPPDKLADILIDEAKEVFQTIEENRQQAALTPTTVVLVTADEDVVPTTTPTPVPTLVPTKIPPVAENLPDRDQTSIECDYDFTVYQDQFQNQPLDFDAGKLSFRVDEGKLKIDANFREDYKYIDFGLPCGSHKDFDLSFDFGIESQSSDSPVRVSVAMRHQNDPETDMRHYFALFSTEGYYGIYYRDLRTGEIKTIIQQDTDILKISAGQSVGIRLGAVGNQLQISLNDTVMSNVLIEDLQSAGQFRMGLDGQGGQEATVTIDNLRVSNTR